ncbi:hypothetical protein B0T20DRAFT_363156 [Sordaria brevicollis]|uniref:Uncharacterized protein n=1 Tax=Sordaria brevicollis TaxID=83679 RepID=A0AAE0U5A6_SORBR|nr:hypothetical protein B0T20DRAFT_363156 [Sordaria brevicollis]
MPSASFNNRRTTNHGNHLEGFPLPRHDGVSSSHRKVVNLGDILDDRYRVVHKIKQTDKSVTYLCRDLEEDKWRRVTVAKSQEFRTAMDEYERGAAARQRLGEQEAERQGFCLRVFSVAGPKGVYMTLVYPLASHEVNLQFAAPYDEAYFLGLLEQWESLE